MSHDLDALIPIVDLESFLARGDRAACEAVARAVRDVGVFILRDPRIPIHLPGRMRELFLEFYRKPPSYKTRYERLDRHRQVGWTPPGEKARTREQERLSFPESERPHLYSGPDVKERFSIPVGPPPEKTDYPSLNQKTPEIPEGIPNWVELTTQWGTLMLDAIRTSIEMAGIGMGMNDPELFLRMTSHGPNILAPTGCDLEKYGKPGTVHSNFHTDMAFATGHGRSNYPGLYVWTRSRKRILVRLPDDGCLLIQVGKQWQILTGGVAHAGFHEVVANEEMYARVLEEIREGLAPWRVSSTLFNHVTSNEILKPYDIFDVPGAWTDGPPIVAGERMLGRLRRSGLSVTTP